MNQAQPETGQPASYLETYALQCAPFGTEADERFFYAGDMLMQRLDLLTHLARFGDSAVLVSGPAGSGKTTLLKRFIRQTTGQWQVCQLDGKEFAGELARAMGGNSTTAPEILLDEWQARTDPSQLLIIMVDNADLLQPHEVEQLGRLLSSPYSERVRLILAGTQDSQKAFNETRQQGLFPHAPQLLEMPRLSEEETSSYLMYRLAVAGYNGESPFATTEIRAICKAAEGRPGKINHLAHESLLERQARTKQKHVRPAGKGNNAAGRAWLVAGTAVILLIAYLGWQRHNEDRPSEQDLRSADGTPISEQPLQLPELTSRPAQPAPAAPTALALDNYNSPIDQPPVGIATAALVPEALHAALPAADGNNHDQAADDATSGETPMASDQAAMPKKIRLQALQREQPAATETPPAPEPTEAPTEPPLSTTPVSQPIEAQSAPTTAELTIVPDTQQLPQETSGPHREPWLLQQPASSYTLQLLGSRQEKSVRDFIDRHQLEPGKSAWYQGTYKGADWYVLVFGVYPDRKTAITERNNLPAAVRKVKPWPRDLKSVQQAIRERPPE